VALLLPANVAPATQVVAVPSACMRGMLPLEQVHPTISTTAAAKRAAAGPAATSAADAAPALKRAKSATAEAMLRRCSSSGSSCANEAAAAAAALAAAAPSPASVCKAAASSAHKPAAVKAPVPPKAPKPAAGIGAAAAPAAAAGAPAAVDAKLPPPMARAQRIKQRPRRPDDPPRPLLDLSSSSSPSKISTFCNKKRPAARMAPAPTTGHSCSQCGATVRHLPGCSSPRRGLHCLSAVIAFVSKVCTGCFDTGGVQQSHVPDIVAAALLAVCSPHLCGALAPLGPRRCATHVACAT
jgi:hypothetical protein